MDIKDLERGDIVEISIFDAVWGKVQILANNRAGRTITYKWLEEPMTCYDNQLSCCGEVDTVPYHDLAYARKVVKEVA